jgi:hypothetical protein
VQPATVEEHRHEDRHQPALVRAGLLHEVLDELAGTRPEILVEGEAGLDTTLRDVRLVRDLPGDLRVAEEEELLLVRCPERRLPEQERGDVRRDDGQGDDRHSRRRVGVADRDHGRRPRTASIVAA